MDAVVVTGGAGFIGSHLCERLVALGVRRVISLDNYFTGTTMNHVPGVEYIVGRAEDISKLIKVAPTQVYHLGEYSRVEQSFEDIKVAYDYNKKGILEVLEFCRARGAKLIYAGSSTKFGDDGMARDASPYAWMKATNTELVVNYDSWFTLPYAITYFYNVFGPREISTGKYATLIGIFRERMRRSEPLGVALPGVQKRNFTHVVDVVDALIEIGRSGHGDGYGIGSDDAFTIFEVAKMFGGEVEILPERPGNRMSGIVCSESTKSLGWVPKRGLEDYILTLRRNEWSY